MNVAGITGSQRLKGSSILMIFLVLFSGPPLFAASKDEILNKKFKDLGIIALSGLSPPADDPLMDMTGNPVKISDFKGKIVLINFWTTWCPGCVYEMPDIEKLHQKMAGKDFVILAVDLRESPETVAGFILKKGLTFKVLQDQKGTMGRAFGIRSIPATFILNRNGGLLGKAMGPRDWDSGESMELFRFLTDRY